MRDSLQRWSIPLACSIALTGILIAIITRVALESRNELKLARGFAEQSQISAAVLHYRRAIRWYYPGSNSVAAAISELRALAIRAEQSQQVAHAMTAWTGLYGGLRAVRSFYQPYAPELAEAGVHMGQHLSSAARRESFKTDITPRVDRIDEQFAHLRAADPNMLGAALLIMGFIAWVVMMSLIALGRKDVVAEHGELQTLPTWYWAASAGAWVLFLAGTWLL